MLILIQFYNTTHYCAKALSFPSFLYIFFLQGARLSLVKKARQRLHFFHVLNQKLLLSFYRSSVDSVPSSWCLERRGY